MIHENYIRVVALDEQGARDFVIQGLGCEDARIDRVTDEGTPNQIEKYKPGARLFYVRLKGNAQGV